MPAYQPEWVGPTVPPTTTSSVMHAHVPEHQLSTWRDYQGVQSKDVRKVLVEGVKQQV